MSSLGGCIKGGEVGLPFRRNGSSMDRTHDVVEHMRGVCLAVWCAGVFFQQRFTGVTICCVFAFFFFSFSLYVFCKRERFLRHNQDIAITDGAYFFNQKICGGTVQ